MNATLLLAVMEPHRCKYGMSGYRLRRVLDYIEDHLSEELSLKAIANVAELSVSHCKYAFSMSVGSPIHRYIIQRRIERAKRLLAENVLSISQVAGQAGFTHKSHLAFHTRRAYGLSPSSLRQQLIGS
jgi:AraC family transcriptional regulator